MKIYQITYYAAEVHHHEHHNCGHDHDHHESCNHEHGKSCNHDHEHHHHHHHHSELPSKIQSLGAWAHIMPTTLLLQTEINAEEIKSALNEVKQVNETFLVTEIIENYAGSLPAGALDWIEKKLK